MRDYFSRDKSTYKSYFHLQIEQGNPKTCEKSRSLFNKKTDFMKKTKLALFAALLIGVLSAFTAIPKANSLDDEAYEVASIQSGKIYLGEDVTNQQIGVDYRCDLPSTAKCVVLINPADIDEDEIGPFVLEEDVISSINGDFVDLKP